MIRILLKRISLLFTTIAFTCNAFSSVGHSLTVSLTKAGTLSEAITEVGYDPHSITSLTVSGELNGTDIALIRDIAGQDEDGFESGGKLDTLDLTNAKIVTGGNPYYKSFFDDTEYNTQDSIVGDYMFNGCSCVTIILPKAIKSVGEYAFASLHFLIDSNLEFMSASQ